MHWLKKKKTIEIAEMGIIEQYGITPWKLIKQIGKVNGYPQAMTFADKDDLVVSVDENGCNVGLHVYKCIG